MKSIAITAISLSLMNAALFITAALVERRLKAGALQFAIAYAMTVSPALRGDPEPFIRILTMPAS